MQGVDQIAIEPLGLRHRPAASAHRHGPDTGAQPRQALRPCQSAAAPVASPDHPRPLAAQGQRIHGGVKWAGCRALSSPSLQSDGSRQRRSAGAEKTGRAPDGVWRPRIPANRSANPRKASSSRRTGEVGALVAANRTPPASAGRQSSCHPQGFGTAPSAPARSGQRPVGGGDQTRDRCTSIPATYELSSSIRSSMASASWLRISRWISSSLIRCAGVDPGAAGPRSSLSRHFAL